MKEDFHCHKIYQIIRINSWWDNTVILSLFQFMNTVSTHSIEKRRSGDLASTATIHNSVTVIYVSFQWTISFQSYDECRSFFVKAIHKHNSMEFHKHNFLVQLTIHWFRWHFRCVIHYFKNSEFWRNMKYVQFEKIKRNWDYYHLIERMKVLNPQPHIWNHIFIWRHTSQWK